MPGFVYKLFSSYLLILSLFFYSHTSFAQIKVVERVSNETQEINNSTVTDKRIKIDLNGKWSVSFDEGATFSNYSVPLCYTYKDLVLFTKKFSLNDSLIKNYSLILCCDGINFETEIKINGIYVAKHYSGFVPFTVPIEENILKNENQINITVNSELDSRRTLPLSNQINFSRIYGGINRDIYFIAVPKLYVSENFLSYKFESDNSVRLINNIFINSDNLEKIKTENKDFSVKTKIYKKQSGEEVAESPAIRFTINDYQNANLTNELILKNVSLWSPENPELYIVKTIISGSGEIDDKIIETGFVNLKFNSANVFINGKQGIFNGINYYEDSPRNSDALSYSEVEKDLLKIKEYGFNCIRVPGRPAHPYVAAICNRIGLFLLQDIPFNEVPANILKNSSYTQNTLDYLESIVKIYKNSPSIIAWGVGNNFDVTCPEAEDYVKKAKEIVNKYDERPVYFTTRNIKKNNCSQFADFIGINISTGTYDKIQEMTTELENTNTKSGKKYFISSYGLAVNNDNRNGFGDAYSLEAQAKYLTEVYKVISKTTFGSFVSSFADWNAERPLNFPLSNNPFLRTDGIFDYNREAKLSAGLMKRVINNQGFQKIAEGSGQILYSDHYYVFIAIGVIALIFLLFLLSKLRYFKENIIKSIITPKNFILFVKEQNLISNVRNLSLSLLISVGTGLYFSSIFYNYRKNVFFDTLLSTILENDSLKQTFSGLVNSPVQLFFVFSIIVFLFILLISCVLLIVNIFAERKAYFKTIFTVTVWSMIPILIMLPAGTVIYKLAQINFSYTYLSLILFVFLLLISIYKLINAAKLIFELSGIKAFLYSFILIILISFGVFAYFYYVKSTINIISLILSYKF